MIERFRMPNVLRRNFLLLRYVGLWPYERRYFMRNNYTYFSLSILMLFLVPDYLLVLLTVFFCDGDLEQLSNSMTYVAQRSITMVQIIFFLRKMAVTKTIMEQLNKDLIQPKTVEEKMVVINSLKSYFFITNSYFTFCCVTCIGYFFLPILLGERKYPFDIWHPLQELRSPWFEIVYIHQVLAVWFNHLMHTGIDMLCAGLMATIGSQCDLLRAKLMNFEPVRKSFGDSATTPGRIVLRPGNVVSETTVDSDYESYFRDIFQHHREILLLAKRVNILFSQLVFGEISLVIIILCTALFRLSVLVNNDRSEFLLVAAFIFAMSLQLFLYCWFGSEVYFKSERLHSGSFHCKWIGSSLSFQKSLTFFMHKTATPIKIYALHFFKLSTVTFTAIMRSSWSYYVLLQQLNTNDENSP